MTFNWLNEHSRNFLDSGYLVDGQSAEGRVRDIAESAEKYLGIAGYADKFYDYMSRGFYSLSSPVWSNYGTDRGLPVSCFGSYIDDDMASILEAHSENGMLMKHGGGTSGYFGALRGRGTPIYKNGKSSGAVHFMELFDKLSSVVSQGSVRRGFFSAYLPIEHNDIDEFLEVGTEGHAIQLITTGVTVSDAFLEAMIAGDSKKRATWAKLLQTRAEIGYPYIIYSDNVNKNKPDVYLDKDMWIFASNMCAEISLPSWLDETFTCVLSSLNVLHWDEILQTDAIEVLTYFLDTVVTEFVEKTKNMPHHAKARRFALRHRALGVGILGWHSLLQSKMIAFESTEATDLNLEIAQVLKKRTYAASAELATLFGEPELLQGYGRRNTTLMAIAPTKSSSYILGQVSQSIEPEFSNFYVKDLAKTKVTICNPYLKLLLAEKGMDTDTVWRTIRDADGSVQDLDFLTEHEKNVFKTFNEISSEVIIEQAGVRQQYIDQSQSLNLMLDPDMSVKEMNALYLLAWRHGVKSLYYSFSMSKAQALTRKKIAECEACAL
jgi:ribonucleoside-diphosphate reductase alpha chain